MTEKKYHPETLSVRAGTEMTPFGENSEALFLNSSFRFNSAAQAAARDYLQEHRPCDLGTQRAHRGSPYASSGRDCISH